MAQKKQAGFLPQKLGPDTCFARNKKLLYGRMTGWGQNGPLAQAAGHDLNYVAITGGAPWSNTYRCADGRYITVQAVEPNFYRELIRLCGLENDPDFTEQHRQSSWPAAREKMASLFASKSQGEWCDRLEGTDACFAPVLSLAEAAAHPHNRARQNFLQDNGLLQPSPAPKFSVTHQEVGVPPSLGQAVLQFVD